MKTKPLQSPSPRKILSELRAQKNPKNIAGMARFGISTNGTLGISIPVLRKMAKWIGKDHATADKLWRSGIHEARILAAFVDEPAKVTPVQMDRWIKDSTRGTCATKCAVGFFIKRRLQ